MEEERRRADFELIEHCRYAFPPLTWVRKDGLVCFGGDLSPERLLAAYSLGLFPWYEEPPILWWCLHPRCVLPLEDFRLPARSARAIRNHPFDLTCDAAFTEVIAACAEPRGDERKTWLIDEMRAAYTVLHQMGYAHSVEAWRDGKLVGGLYGIGLGQAFFGESMFHRVPEASRAALAGLVQLLRERQVILLDCQQESPHMMRMGAKLLTLKEFAKKLRQAGLGNDFTREAAEPWKASYAWASDSSSWRLKSK